MSLKPERAESLHSGMKTSHPIYVAVIASVFALSMVIVGCSKSEEPTASDASATEPKADTSYLDQLAAEQGIELDDDEPQVSTQSETRDDEPQFSEQDDADDEDREWVKDDGSQSLFGRSRDKAKDIQNQIRGGTSAEDGLANTLLDEEYASSSGLRWEMPEDWRMAMPSRGNFAEMYIMHALGNASVSFTKEEANTRALIRNMQDQIIDPMGGRSRAKTSEKTIQGKPVTVVELEGTYLDPGAKGGTNEQIFYAIHAAIFDLGDSRILIKMWGPQDTVNQSTILFDKMINETTTE
jgi:hypothetical protein